MSSGASKKRVLEDNDEAEGSANKKAKLEGEAQSSEPSSPVILRKVNWNDEEVCVLVNSGTTAVGCGSANNPRLC